MNTKIYQVDGMDCAHCATTMSNGIKKLENVEFVEVDFISGKMQIVGDVDEDAIRQRTQQLGYKIVDEEQTKDREPSRGGLIGFFDYLLRSEETRLALIGGLIGIIGLASLALNLPEAVSTVIFTLAVLITGIPVYKSGINAVILNRTFNINTLMTIAAGGALILGEMFEAVVVIFLFAVGEALEGYVAERNRDNLRSLMTLVPDTATRINDEGERVVPVEMLKVGDKIIVKAGERIPMDGDVLSGESGVDQSPITGESLPVHKAQGDEVYAGTVNGTGTLTIEVTQLAENNTLSRIVQMVEQSHKNRAKSQRTIDRFAEYYTPAVVALAALIALAPPLLLGQPFWNTATEQGWFYRALTLLVIACPCALVISTPVTVISAISRSARNGVLIKGGVYLEALAGIRAFAFDKTGTLTQGKPQVQTIRAADCKIADDNCDACQDVLALASALEKRSSHPLAQAVIDEAHKYQLDTVYAPAENVETLAGQGVRGTVNGQDVIVGSHRYFDTHYPHEDAFCATIADAEAHGQTTMLVREADTVRGFIGVADTVRDVSKQVIAELRKLDVTSVMLTGDTTATAQAVSASVGVDTFRAELMPEDKVNAVEQLKQDYQTVAMVGDGVNDTPALASATLGIAMGGAGTAQAMETADIVLMADDLSKLPVTIRLARFARSIIVQNIALTFAVKALFITLAIFFETSLWLAIFADVGMLVIVTLNGMRPLRFKG